MDFQKVLTQQALESYGSLFRYFSTFLCADDLLCCRKPKVAKENTKAPGLSFTAAAVFQSKLYNYTL